MSIQFKCYCHDFRELMVSLSWLGQLVGYVKEFDEYRTRTLISTDEMSFGLHKEPNYASYVFVGKDGDKQEIVLNRNGRVPMVKTINGLRELLMSQPELFKLMVLHAKDIKASCLKISAELMKKHSEDLSERIYTFGLSDYKKLVETDMVASSRFWVTLWVWFFNSPEIASQFGLGLDQSMLLGMSTTRARTRYYRDCKVNLMHTDQDHYYIMLHFETLNHSETAIVYKHLDPDFWVEHEVETIELIKNIFKD